MEFGVVELWTSWLASQRRCSPAGPDVPLFYRSDDERYLSFQAAKKQSLRFATQATQLLKQNKLKEVIALSKQYKKSHLAKVVSAGLYEFTYETENPGAAEFDVVDAAKRAIEREATMTSAEFKRGLGGLATIGTTAPLSVFSDSRRNHQRFPVVWL